MSAPAHASSTVSFTLNGQPVSTPHGDRSLLDVLREDFDIISPKNGCQPMGQCGCCTILIDGKPRLSCTIKASVAAGKKVTTLEGLPEPTRQQIADCFVHAGAVQCGFCIPGIAMRAHALCEKNPAPTHDQITGDLRAHLCRCTGYTKIVDAIDLLARVRGGEPMPSNGCAGKVGERLHRYTGHDAALGMRRYIDDIKVPGMVFAAPRLSDHPRALVKKINTAPAMAVPGVLRVVTAADVPGDRFVGLITPDWPVFIAEGEETRYVGDVLAFVVAADVHAARYAADQIEIEYDVRTPVTTPDDALKPDAPKIHPGGNLLSRSALVRGEPDAVLAASAHVVENVWQTQCIEHLYLEPEAAIAIPEGDGLKLLTQGQGIFDDRRQTAKVLGWPIERVRAELVSNGGAFGGKEDMSVQAQTALCAVLVNKPVKCVLTREQSLRLHPKRHPVRISLKVGCDAEGKLTAARVRIIGDKGAYASVGAKVLERAAGHAIGPYKCDNIDIESLAVYTNNPPNGAMRGFGANQAAYAIEGALDMLAAKVGIDGWEIRWRNILRPGDRFCTGQRLTKPFGLEQTLLAVRDAYRAEKFAGIACGIKNVGIGNGLPEIGCASLTVEADGSITIRTGHTEMGQGLFTIAIQTAVQETGLPHEIFTARCDTSDPNDSGQTTGSRGTVLTCHAVIDACKKLNADLKELHLPPADSSRANANQPQARSNEPHSNEPRASARAAMPALMKLAGRKYLGRWECYKTDKFGADVPEPKTHLTYGFATQVCILDETGRIKKFIAAHDVGRVMNPTLLEGQLEGSIHMGLGYALTEEMVYDGGRLVTDDVKSCGVLRAHHMPPIEIILVEVPDPDCPYGARGVAEIGLVPTAPSVAGALAKFEGFHRTTLPMKDSPAAKAILGPRAG
ncbi:MAG: selenium-dependent xanthine dehydrogenase [Phycisphaerae bacterium]|nr:MAG: molybdopterin-dependent oxidoreductase [Planctomycetia bacterium]GJQ26485.1 MAG: selenium-dependent xanthine dehydrogenase [Phycisphaerae bacterium]